MNDALERYVQKHLTEMRAPLKERTVFTTAGRSVQRAAGERIILGPNGQPIRVIENPDGGNQIEHGDHLHAVIRPRPINLALGIKEQ